MARSAPCLHFIPGRAEFSKSGEVCAELYAARLGAGWGLQRPRACPLGAHLPRTQKQAVLHTQHPVTSLGKAARKKAVLGERLFKRGVEGGLLRRW